MTINNEIAAIENSNKLAQESVINAIRTSLEIYRELCEKIDSSLELMPETKSDFNLANMGKESVSLTFSRENLGYVIANEHSFNHWISKGSDFGYDDVNQAIRHFERINPDMKDSPVLESILNIERFSQLLGHSTATRTNIIRKLIWEIRGKYSMDD